MYHKNQLNTPQLTQQSQIISSLSPILTKKPNKHKQIIFWLKQPANAHSWLLAEYINIQIL